MTEGLRKRQEAVPGQLNVQKPNKAGNTRGTQVVVPKDEPTVALDALALFLGLTLVALLFNAVAPDPYMVSTGDRQIQSLWMIKSATLSCYQHTSMTFIIV